MSVDKLAGRPNILGDESRRLTISLTKEQADYESRRLTISLTKEQADYMRSQAEGSHVTISATFRELVDAAMSGKPLDVPELSADGR